MAHLTDYLAQRTYPGRGILFGKTHDGINAVAAYFIMGRSPNSRNRVFVQTSYGINTRPCDITKVSDPSLILYSPVRSYQDELIVTNGDQTDTVCDFLMHGGTFRSALLTRCYEPDAPNFTPRISGILHIGGGEPAYTISILRKAAQSMDCERAFFDYAAMSAGTGHLIHTYADNIDSLSSFEGEPLTMHLPEGNIDMFTDALWNSLHAQNRISLFVQFLPLNGGKADTRIRNKYEIAQKE